MFFSVIVPLYNVERYLRECVDSILAQTYRDFELILVDDGSTDASGAICDEYAARDARVRVIHKENGGQSTARNAGVRLAEGEYAIFLDSDDFIDSTAFFADLKDAIAADTDVVIYRYYKYYDTSRKFECGGALTGISLSSRAEFFTELVKRDAFFCSCWSKCTSLRLLKEHEIFFDEDSRCEDMDWYYSVVCAAKSFAVIDRPYVNYRQRENSVTSAFKPKSVYDFIAMFEKWWPRLSEIADEAERTALLSSLAKLYCNLLILYTRNAKHLKDVKKKIFSFRPLLRYSLNPRTRTIAKFSKLFGMNLTCLALRTLDKVKKA